MASQRHMHAKASDLPRWRQRTAIAAPTGLLPAVHPWPRSVQSQVAPPQRHLITQAYPFAEIDEGDGYDQPEAYAREGQCPPQRSQASGDDQPDTAARQCQGGKQVWRANRYDAPEVSNYPGYPFAEIDEGGRYDRPEAYAAKAGISPGGGRGRRSLRRPVCWQRPTLGPGPSRARWRRSRGI